MSNPNTRKSCVVPKCKNTTTNSPEKLFFIVPKDVKMRKKWIKAMKRLDPFGDKSTVYCCEDHFDIENDMENYTKYKLVGGRIKLKQGIVPHKFKCQQEKEDKPQRSAVLKVKLNKKTRVERERHRIMGRERRARRAKSKNKVCDIGTEKQQAHYNLDHIEISHIKTEVEDDSIENLADDIDIEEHDLLDNPKLKDIFPDLTKVEIEIFGCNENYFNDEKSLIKLQPTDNEISHIKQENNKNLIVVSDITPEQNTNSYLNAENINAFVLLNDIEPILNSSGCYCTECKTLFPTVNALDAHNMSNHECAPSTNRRGGDNLKDIRNISSCNETYNPSRSKKCYVHEANDHAYFNIDSDRNGIAERFKKSNLISKGMAQDTTFLQYNAIQVNKLKTDLKTEQNAILSNVDEVANNIETHRYIFNDNETQKASVDISEKIPNQIQEKCNERNVECNNLIKHIRSQTVQKPYECNLCSKKFRRPEILNAHLRTHRGEKPYECNVCLKKFGYLDSLKIHLRIHTGEKPYECNVCLKKFIRLGVLSRHLQTHTGDKPYQCDMCLRKFTRLGSLKIHLRTHTGEKPYDCNVCLKKFSQLENFKRHLRTHTGEKPHQCNVCSKKFSELGNLNTHLRTHTGEKPYDCNVCLKKFNQLGYLKKHLRTHTRERL